MLTFWHRYAFEQGTGTTGYDGVVEISTNGGSSWTDLGSSITSGGYTHTISSSYGNPLAGRQAWSGDLTSFSQVTANLGSFAGTYRLVRWRMGCDTSQADGTWYVDDIQITNVATPGTCTTGGGCTNPGAPTITEISDESACAQSGIRVSYTAGSGATSHDLYRDSVRVVTGSVRRSVRTRGHQLAQLRGAGGGVDLLHGQREPELSPTPTPPRRRPPRRP